MPTPRALLFALVALSPVAALRAAPLPGTSCTVFPANNIWNTDISTLPVHASSADWLGAMNASRSSLHADFGPAPYGLPLTVTDNSQATVRPTFLYAAESDPGPYPFGPQTRIENGADSLGDRHALIVNRDTCTLFELGNAWWNGGAATADAGAVFDLRSNALRPPDWTSADAAGLPITAGLVSYDEVAAGVIRHALRFTAAPTDRRYVWPARHQAGARSDAKLPPMGARLRLQAGYDISRFSREAQVILTALKRYGMMLADNGSNFFLQGSEDARWPETIYGEIAAVPAAAFDVVDVSSLIIDPDSAEARQPGAPVAAIYPTSIDFGTVIVRQSSAVRVITVTNQGSADLVISALTPGGTNAGDFPITATSCLNTRVAPLASCTIQLKFKPRAIGSRVANLSLADNAAGSPHVLWFIGTGRRR